MYLHPGVGWTAHTVGMLDLKCNVVNQEEIRKLGPKATLSYIQTADQPCAVEGVL